MSDALTVPIEKSTAIFGLDNHPGLPFILVGILLMVFFGRRLGKIRREKLQKEREKLKEKEEDWL